MLGVSHCRQITARVLIDLMDRPTVGRTPRTVKRIVPGLLVTCEISASSVDIRNDHGTMTIVATFGRHDMKGGVDETIRFQIPIQT